VGFLGVSFYVLFSESAVLLVLLVTREEEGERGHMWTKKQKRQQTKTSGFSKTGFEWLTAEVTCCGTNYLTEVRFDDKAGGYIARWCEKGKRSTTFHAPDEFRFVGA
jgi:hypothetical protein